MCPLAPSSSSLDMNESLKISDSPQRAKGYTLGAFKESVEGLSPAYFAFVMATGIVSIAAQFLGMAAVAVALFWLNVGAYLILFFLNALRVIWFPRRFFSDMVDHQRGPGFFTSVAASCVLGSQFVRIAGNYPAAIFLWVVGIILWAGLTYTIFTAFTVKEKKPTLE